MKKQTIVVLAAAALLSGVTAASAAGVASSHSGMAKPISDTLSLNTDQQKTAWNDLNKQAANQTAPSGFDATAGTVVPQTVKINAMPRKAARDVSALQPYDFAVVSGKLLIVNPHDRKIAEVITG